MSPGMSEITLQKALGTPLTGQSGRGLARGGEDGGGTRLSGGHMGRRDKR